MTEEDLESVGIPAIAEVEDGEGVTEAMGVAVGDVGTISEGDEEFEEAITGEGLILLGDDQGGIQGCIRAGDEVFPEGLGGFG